MDLLLGSDQQARAQKIKLGRWNRFMNDCMARIRAGAATVKDSGCSKDGECSKRRLHCPG